MAYDENVQAHVKQWQLAGELVDQAEALGIHKDAYVLDAALLVPELAAENRKSRSIMGFTIGKKSAG